LLHEGRHKTAPERHLLLSPRGLWPTTHLPTTHLRIGLTVLFLDVHLLLCL
jgi:hypothetical protein